MLQTIGSNHKGFISALDGRHQPKRFTSAIDGRQQPQEVCKLFWVFSNLQRMIVAMGQ